LLTCDLRTMSFRMLNTKRQPECPVCGL